MGKGIYTRIIGVLKYIFEILLIVGIIAAFGIGTYVIADTYRVVNSALPVEYEMFKPEPERIDGAKEFERLKELNKDVVGWIEIYGTNINYPMVRGENNNKYLKTNPMGEYSLAGSIFMDYRSRRDFTDFNTIIYGHNMAYNAMFGDISDYVDKEFFDKHIYGDIFFDGRNHGIEVKAFLEVDAYKSGLYIPGDTSLEERQGFIKEVYESAKYTRGEKITTQDRVVLLSTCTTDVTNGRHILICTLTDEVYEDTFKTDPEAKDIRNVDSVGMGVQSLIYILVILAVVVLLGVIAIAFRRAEKKREYIKTDRRQRR